jgi:uncharacterized C2H2 Zn-finger protein
MADGTHILLFFKVLYRFHVRPYVHFVLQMDDTFEVYPEVENVKTVVIKTAHRECDLCEYSSAKLYNLKRHIRTKHQQQTDAREEDPPEEGNTLKASSLCPHCGALFTDRRNMLRHVRVIHKQQKHHICHTCGKGFDRKATLQTHMYSHETQKCKDCSEECPDKEALKKHMKDVRHALSCTICTKCFASRRSVLEHVQLCHSEAKFKCHACNREFKWKRSLRRHQCEGRKF